MFFVDGLGGWMGETSDYFMDNGARYWRLIDGLFGVIEAIKARVNAGAPCSTSKPGNHF